VNKIDIFRATIFNMNPDIVGVTESWCTPAIFNAELLLHNYELFRCDRSGNHKGGDVLLYVKSTFKPTEYAVTSEFVDSVWCTVNDLLIGVCYRSSNHKIVGCDNDSKLLTLLQEVNNKQIVLMGDFNHPDINWSSYAVPDDAPQCCKDFFNCVDECFLMQHVSDPTRENYILDLVFSREPELVSDVQVIENLGNTDHNMITFRVHHQQRVINSMRPMRDYHRGDYQSIKEQLKTVDWEDVTSGYMCTRWITLKAYY